MIELFKQPNINWMGKAKYFYALSGILLLAGWTSIFVSGGLRYGIDFKGGTLVYVRFANTPPVDKLRQGLVQQGLGDSVIQQISDIATPNANEVVISMANFEFPPEVVVPVGSTVVWVNQDGAPHTATADDSHSFQSVLCRGFSPRYPPVPSMYDSQQPNTTRARQHHVFTCTRPH